MRRTPAVAVVACAVLLLCAAVALAAPKSGKYKGKSTGANSQPLRFQVSSGGKDLVDFSPTFEVTCTKRNSTDQTIIITTNGGARTAIKHNAFNGKFSGAISQGSKKLATAHGRFEGSFSDSKTASGTYSVQFTLNNAAHSLKGYHCTTGTVHWNAKHA